MKRYTALLTLAVLLASCGQQSATPVVTDGPLMIQGELMSTATAILTMPNISAVLNQKLPLAITPTASGFTPVIYTLQPSTLPRGLTFNSRTGAISGTPLILSATQTYRIIGTQYSPAAQASTTFTLGVVAGLSSTTNPVLLTSTYPSQTLAGGGPFTATPTTQVTGPAMYTLGTLPAGVSGVTLNSSTGVLSGNVIATPGVYVIPVTVTATANSPVQSVNTTLTLTVTANPAVYPNGNSLTLNELTPFMLAPLADTATQTYTLVSNTGMFTGLTVNPITGVLSGISPIDPENDDLPNIYTAVVQVMDSAPPAGVAPVFTTTITFTVNPFIVTYPLGNVTVLTGTGPGPIVGSGNGTGLLENQNIVPSTVNGTGGVSYARLNNLDPEFVALPGGVLNGAPFFNVDSATGKLINATLTGVPAAGTYQITVKATDSNPSTNRTDTTTVLIQVQGFSLAVAETTTNPNFLPDPVNPGTKILTLTRPSSSKTTVTSDLLLTGTGLNGFANTVALDLGRPTNPPSFLPPAGVTLTTPNPASMTVSPVPNQIPLGLTVSNAATAGTYTLDVRGLYTGANPTVGNTTAISNSFKLRIANTSGFSQVSAGANSACGIGSDGNIYCWGSDSNGQLGDGAAAGNLSAPASNRPVIKPAGVTTWRNVSVGNQSACAIAASGANINLLYCWGDGSSGQLGDNTALGSPSPVQASALFWNSVSVGNSTACGITTGSVAYCWGGNFDGQVGDNTTVQKNVPTAVNVGLLGITTFKSISAGSLDTCAIGSDNNIYCWGENDKGQAGRNNTTQFSRPQGPSNAGLLSAITAKSVTTGFDTTCAVLNNNSTYCWGEGSTGELGDGNNTDSLLPVIVSGGLTFQSVNLTLSSNPNGGGTQICGITPTNSTYCWGAGTSGQIGNGLTNNVSVPTLVSVLPIGTTLSQVSAGENFTCGLSTNFQIYCWGNNNVGQQGIGSTNNQIAGPVSPVIIP